MLTKLLFKRCGKCKKICLWLTKLYINKETAYPYCCWQEVWCCCRTKDLVLCLHTKCMCAHMCVCVYVRYMLKGWVEKPQGPAVTSFLAHDWVLLSSIRLTLLDLPFSNTNAHTHTHTKFSPVQIEPQSQHSELSEEAVGGRNPSLSFVPLMCMKVWTAMSELPR